MGFSLFFHPKVCRCLLPILVITCTITWPAGLAEAAKILGLFAHPSESHFAVMRSVMTELARREHNVTIYSSHRLPERIDNLKEHVVEPEFPFWIELQKAAGTKSGLLELGKLNANAMQKALATVGSAAVDYFLSNGAVQELLMVPKLTFDYDLIIVDVFYTEALLAFGHIHNVSAIGIVSSNFENYMQHVIENFVPVACSPIDFDASLGEAKGGFWKRLTNTRQCLKRREIFVDWNMAAQEKLIKKYFKHFGDVSQISIPQLQSELGILLLNNHIPLMKPRPLLSNIILAGGLHIRPPRDLPWNIKRFVDESRAGVIYMHLGNEQLCGAIPADILKTLLNVLRKRKEHIVWTCHDIEKIDGLPKNIMLQHQVPQADILAHPHVNAFVMNGDLLGLQEGIVRHVPMVGLPIFRNEIQNIEFAVDMGIAIKLDYTNLTETAFNEALETILHDSSYHMTIRRVSTEFRDRPLGALETSMYWIDYVLKHSNGDQIKTVGVGLSNRHLHLFDLYIFYFALAVIFVGVSWGFIYIGLIVWRQQKLKARQSKER